MKKSIADFIYSLGTILVMLGIVFRFLNYPGATVLLMLGVLCAAVSYLSKTFSKELEKDEELTKSQKRLERTAKVFRNLSAAALIIGAMFKIQHWPGASLLILIGGALMLVSFVFQVLKLFSSSEVEESTILDDEI